MLTADIIFSLKNKYGNIYSVDIKNQTVVFRELTFKEYDKILYLKTLEDIDSSDIEDIILEYAVIYPEGFDTMTIPPGIVANLSSEILDISGFFSASIAKRILEEKRVEANDVKNLMKAFVLATITSYAPEDLEDMTALSEKIIEIKQNANGMESTDLKIQLIDPEEEEQKRKISAARHNLSKKDGEAQYEDPIAQKLWGMK
jgi:hypothetical protein